ncbi:hypothetical protein PR048_000518 [Dryococelus australis]|uniref:Uncharacterized protein n=1 Tax=Dryococelus australis TaxID=614101 RepID=A0ABQ9IH80_9NEOP|nr:hypothetical protein PR048_000518 [Dryococelus australis]
MPPYATTRRYQRAGLVGNPVATEQRNNTYRTLHVYVEGPIVWPPRSPDLTPLDFYLWGHVKTLVYDTPVNTREELETRIRVAFETLKNTQAIFNNVLRNLLRCCRACIECGGDHFEQLLYSLCRFFSGFSRFSRPRIPALLHTHLASSSSALMTLTLIATQISLGHVYMAIVKRDSSHRESYSRITIAGYVTPQRASNIDDGYRVTGSFHPSPRRRLDDPTTRYEASPHIPLQGPPTQDKLGCRRWLGITVIPFAAYSLIPSSERELLTAGGGGNLPSHSVPLRLSSAPACDRRFTHEMIQPPPPPPRFSPQFIPSVNAPAQKILRREHVFKIGSTHGVESIPKIGCAHPARSVYLIFSLWIRLYQDWKDDAMFAGRLYNLVTDNTIENNVISFEQAHDYDAITISSWQLGWGPVATGCKFGRVRKSRSTIRRNACLASEVSTSLRSDRHMGYHDDVCRAKQSDTGRIPDIARGQRAVVARLLAFHRGESRSIPRGIAPRFPRVGIALDDANGQWVFSGISRFPRPGISPDLSAPLLTQPHPDFAFVCSTPLPPDMNKLRALKEQKGIFNHCDIVGKGCSRSAHFIVNRLYLVSVKHVWGDISLRRSSSPACGEIKGTGRVWEGNGGRKQPSAHRLGVHTVHGDPPQTPCCFPGPALCWGRTLPARPPPPTPRPTAPAPTTARCSSWRTTAKRKEVSRTSPVHSLLRRHSTTILQTVHDKWSGSGPVGRAFPSGDAVAQWLEHSQVGPQWINGYKYIKWGRRDPVARMIAIFLNKSMPNEAGEGSASPSIQDTPKTATGDRVFGNMLVVSRVEKTSKEGAVFRAPYLLPGKLVCQSRMPLLPPHHPTTKYVDACIGEDVSSNPGPAILNSASPGFSKSLEANAVHLSPLAFLSQLPSDTLWGTGSYAPNETNGPCKMVRNPEPPRRRRDIHLVLTMTNLSPVTPLVYAQVHSFEKVDYPEITIAGARKWHRTWQYVNRKHHNIVSHQSCITGDQHLQDALIVLDHLQHGDGS